MPKKGATRKEATSFHLSPEAKKLLAALAEKDNRSRAAWIETMILREAKRQKVTVEDSTE